MLSTSSTSTCDTAARRRLTTAGVPVSRLGLLPSHPMDPRAKLLAAGQPYGFQAGWHPSEGERGRGVSVAQPNGILHCVQKLPVDFKSSCFFPVGMSGTN